MRGTQNLVNVNQQFQDVLRWFDNWLQNFGVELRIVSGFRSGAEQTALYVKGRTPSEIANHVAKHGVGGAVTDAWAGQSAHNYGLAVDLDADYEYTQPIMAAAKIIGFGTVSWDPVHLEWPGWRRVAGV